VNMNANMQSVPEYTHFIHMHYLHLTVLNVVAASNTFDKHVNYSDMTKQFNKRSYSVHGNSWENTYP
jgi:hypothetical protein